MEGGGWRGATLVVRYRVIQVREGRCKINSSKFRGWFVGILGFRTYISERYAGGRKDEGVRAVMIWLSTIHMVGGWVGGLVDRRWLKSR